MLSSSSHQPTATASEMICRFRNATPTSRAIRDAMRYNGDTPVRMWYDEVLVDANSSSLMKQKIVKAIDDTHKTTLARLSNLNVEDISLGNITKATCARSQPENLPWRARFRFGLKGKTQKEQRNIDADS